MNCGPSSGEPLAPAADNLKQKLRRSPTYGKRTTDALASGVSCCRASNSLKLKRDTFDKLWALIDFDKWVLHAILYASLTNCHRTATNSPARHLYSSSAAPLALLDPS